MWQRALTIRKWWWVQGGGFSWLLPLTDGAPPIGWPQALAYLSLPVALVVSQYVSQKIISPPPSDDPSQQNTQWILKFLPIMIGDCLDEIPPFALSEQTSILLRDIVYGRRHARPVISWLPCDAFQGCECCN